MKKFVNWGAGKLGRIAAAYLKRYEIACIVDANPALHGTYNGIPVVAPEAFLRSEWTRCPVVVTPKDHEEEITSWLNGHGIRWHFSFAEEQPKIAMYAMQLPGGMLRSLLDVPSPVYVYGVNVLALLVVSDLQKRGRQCFLLFDGAQCDSLARRLPEEGAPPVRRLDEEFSAVGEVILAEPPSESAREILSRQVLACRNLFGISMHRTLFRNPRLERFKDCHKGQRCFVVGNGPSLKIADLETLRRNGATCFGVNGIIKAFSDTAWRPDYYCMSDPYAFFLWEGALRKDGAGARALFFSDAACHFADAENPPNWYECHLFMNCEHEIAFSDDFSCGGYWGYTVVYDICLQLAAYMGFSEIYLLGCDCSFGKDGAHHFVKDYENDTGNTTTRPQNFAKVMRPYQSAKAYADSHGFRIYNATRGGALEVFERVDFDSLF